MANQQNNDKVKDNSKYVYATPVKCTSLGENGYVMLNGQPCQLVEVPNIKMVAQNLITGKNVETEYRITEKLNVPIVTSSYYQVLSVTEQSFLNLKLYNENEGEDDKIRDDLKVPDDEMGIRLLDEIANPDRDVFCSVIKTFGKERITSINGFPKFPDFYRLPVEMKEAIFSHLNFPDLVNVRRVCTSFKSILPIASLARIHSVRISKQKILVRGGPHKEAFIPALRAVSVPRLQNIPPELLRTSSEVLLRERVNTDDLHLILSHCKNLKKIDLDYPVDKTMDILETFISNNSESLQSFCLWDYFWYNSHNEAFDCSTLSECKSLENLTLFVKYIKNIHAIPQCLSILKLDALTIEQINWIIENFKFLKLFRCELEHSHHGSSCAEISDNVLISLCELPEIQQLDLNLTIKENEMEGNYSLCPEVFQFQLLCNSMDGIVADSDVWGRCCTLQIIVDQNVFQGFTSHA